METIKYNRVDYSVLVLLILATGIIGACSPGAQREPGMNSLANGIIGGSKTNAGKGEMESVVGLLGSHYACTGTLIADNVVLTAAHCIESESSPDMKVIFGDDLYSGDYQSRNVIHALRHKQYDKNAYRDSNDIAVVIFSGKTPSGWKRARLLKDPGQLKDGGTVLLAGYGVTDGINGTGDGVLRRTNTQIKNARFSRSEAQIDQRYGHGSCDGDSGGPAFLVINNEPILWGVTSRGDQHCNVDGIYTKVPAYGQWLQQVIKNFQAQIVANDESSDDSSDREEIDTDVDGAEKTAGSREQSIDSMTSDQAKVLAMGMCTRKWERTSCARFDAYTQCLFGSDETWTVTQCRALAARAGNY